MKTGDVSKKRGFTIIEVSLVLAIAGLIFMMIFVALPALRRTQRNTDRREDITTLLKKVKDYQANNRGALPGGSDNIDSGINVAWGSITSADKETSWAGFYRDYLGERFIDPDGERYQLSVAKCSSGGTLKVDDECAVGITEDTPFPNDYKMMIIVQAKCYGEKAVAVANPHKIAVMYRMDGAGVYCDNT